jgi:hypothetical protein
VDSPTGAPTADQFRTLSPGDWPGEFLKASMITIHKYQFEIADSIEIEMPIHSDILSIQLQNNKPTMWAKIDTSLQMAKRIFLVFGTGHEMSSVFDYRHIGTLQVNGHVWHIFE